MSKYLGDLEKSILGAIIQSENQASGLEIQNWISTYLDRNLSLSAIYSTLDRLEHKGLTSSRKASPSANRGGRAKIFFSITSAGRKNLAQSLKQNQKILGHLGWV